MCSQCYGAFYNKWYKWEIFDMVDGTFVVRIFYFVMQMVKFLQNWTLAIKLQLGQVYVTWSAGSQLCLTIVMLNIFTLIYSKTCVKRPLSKRPKIGFQDQFLLNAGQKYCRMLQESILQYFRPSLSYHLSLRPLFCLFLSGRLGQVLL